MRFTKMQGCGNDYVYVNCFAEKPPVNAPALSQKVSNRNFGVGSDGLILICPSEKADARMIMFNADGSESEMCGNGIRCVAKYVYDHGIARKPTLTIETGRGVLTLEVEVQAGKVQQVRVDMGEPILEAAKIPTTLPGAPPQEVLLPAHGLKVTCVSMGNPHAVTFVGSRDEAWQLANTVGPAIERHAYFPQRTNAEFAHVKSRTEIDLVVWERGAGLTLACGTGACATVVAAILTGRCDEGPAVRVNLPGGSLEIQVMPELSNVKMSGPAAHVFDGTLDLSGLRPRPR